MIGIIDYDSGNIFSLAAAFNRLDANHRLVTAPTEINNCTALVLPGVGAFGDAINNLKAKGLNEAILHWVNAGKPLLGICLGMQLLFEKSEEHGIYQGLGILPGTIRRITGQVKVPHMGWNKLHIISNHNLLQNISDGYVYFVHSYYAAEASEVVLASTFYGEEIPAVVGKNNVLGMQFHPEKSGPVGMTLLKNWVELIEASDKR
ncbi:MAG: imidazole glycerol phosphate synthase [Clostridiaceae bacterium BRH_c20a]|nr:MAG: imidazole glycerol phosphate synthase [Clostridiaceae bacterium BRH_c20a]